MMIKFFLLALIVASATAQCFGNGCGNRPNVVVVQARSPCYGNGCGCVGNNCGMRILPAFGGWGNRPCCSGSNFSCCNRPMFWGRK